MSVLYMVIGVVLAAYFNDEIKSPATLNYYPFNFFNVSGKGYGIVAISFYYNVIILIYIQYYKIFYHYFPTSSINFKFSS